MTTKAQKWGNICVRIPIKVAEKYGLYNGSPIKIEEKENGIFVKPIEKKPTLEELLSQVTEENRHKEIDFGGPMGRELL